MNVYSKVSEGERALLRLSALQGLCYATIRMIPSIIVESVSRDFPAVWVGDSNKFVFKAVSQTFWMPYEDSGVNENDINLYDVVSCGEKYMLENLFGKGGIYASVRKSPLTGHFHVLGVSPKAPTVPLTKELLLFKATSATEWKEVMIDEKICVS